MPNDNIREIALKAKAAGQWLAYRRAAVAIRKSGDASSQSRTLKLAFLSSYTVDPLADYALVEAAAQGIDIKTQVGDFGQIFQEILDPESRLCAFQPDVTIVVASPLAFDWPPKAPATANDAKQAAERVVAAQKSLAESFCRNVSGTLLLTTFPASPSWPFYLTPDEAMFGLREANRQMFATFADNVRTRIFDLDSLCAYFGYRESLSPEMYSMALCPFSEAFLAHFAAKLVAYVQNQRGLTKKCLVLDCDNVLWGGIVGEDGVEGIHLGPESPGREFVEFQKTVLELFEQGAVLAINSKNNEADVRRVLVEHPHMVLREKHFASIQANWNDKPSNMRRIADELHLGVDSFVFIDDNPAEREMMRRMLPEVATVEMPANPSLYARTLRETSYFAVAGLTDEDRRRGAMYVEERQREQLRQSAATVEEFLISLKMAVSIAPAVESDIRRLASLSQRTNQFNLTTRRYSEADMAALLADSTYGVYVLRLRDRFGDAGVVGMAVVATQPNCWRIDAFLLSCRVIGRQVEFALADRILRDAVAAGAKIVTAEYIPTAKNGLAAEFWRQVGFRPIPAEKTPTESSSVDGNRTAWQFGMSEFQPRTFPFLNLENS